MNYASIFDNCIFCDPETNLDKMLLDMPGKPGVCLLCASNEKPILLLHGANIRLIVKRRLEQTAEDGKTKKANLRPIVTKLYFKNSYSKFEMQLDYFQTALQIYPKSWQNLFPKLSSWYLLLDKSGPVPIFKTVKRYEPEKGRHWGPFATKVNAERMLEAIIVIHKLCRCHANLLNAPHATPCSYAQMDLCLRVCDGTTSFANYDLIIEKAIRFLNEPVQASLESMENQIREYSIQLEFEKAEKMHRIATECKKIAGKAYRWIGPMENFQIISLQPGPKFKAEGHLKEPGITSVIISSTGGINKLETFPLSESDNNCRSIVETTRHTKHPFETSLTHQQQYMLAWITQLINKSDKQQGIFIKVSDTLSALDISEQIKNHFSTNQ